MSWRNQGITGSNNIPLGNRRRFGGDNANNNADDVGYNPAEPANGMSELKRGRSPTRGKCPPLPAYCTTTDTILQRPMAQRDARSAIVGVMRARTRLLV